MGHIVIDILPLINSILPYFDRSKLSRAVELSCKNTANVSGINGKYPVPQEAVYHHELTQILDSLFCAPIYVVEPENNIGLGNCDILIQKCTGVRKRYLLELIATPTRPEVNTHVIKQRKRNQIWQLDEYFSWIIIFTCQPFLEDYLWDQYKNTIIVWHNLDYNTLEMYYKDSHIVWKQVIPICK
eukprot:TRINITY_DN7397_c0_g1_i1.p1 TRINITY_DN7397_c0_g1~~TRINITY_DN7397_c0_g1_i1.p1  ORF type:complete len:185 (-),score=22.93 TRINITY_DN7397_c0_g1_i1:33-587(-)